MKDYTHNEYISKKAEIYASVECMGSRFILIWPCKEEGSCSQPLTDETKLIYSRRIF